MTPPGQEQRERLAAVSEALQTGLPVPTDTFITEDIPLLLTKLSQVPAARNGKGRPRKR
ncbi:MAG: hypothetical protein PGN08_08540 [Sphingomonas taxi]